MGVSPTNTAPWRHRPGAWGGFYLITASDAESQGAAELGPEVAGNDRAMWLRSWY